MKKLIFLILISISLCLSPALAAKFNSNRTVLRPGTATTTTSPKNKNDTTFSFIAITTNERNAKKAAFVEWTPLGKRARKYKNGALIDEASSVNLKINGVWFNLRFDGTVLELR